MEDGLPSARSTLSEKANGSTWVSVGIAYHYVLVGYYLANATGQLGDRNTAAQIMQTVDQMARVAGLERSQQGGAQGTDQ